MHKGNQIKKRINFIDIAKGISILLVAFGHSDLSHLSPALHESLGLFRMPLFFFLSGVFFSVSSKPKAFILDKTDALLKPYFVTLFSFAFLSSIFPEYVGSKSLVGVFYGNGSVIQVEPLWFLTHLWALFMLSYLLFYYTGLQKASDMIKVLFILFLFVFGSFYIDTFKYFHLTISTKEIPLRGLPYSLDIASISIAFFLSGHFLSKRIQLFRPNIKILLFAVFTLTSISIYTDAYIELNQRTYNEPLMTTFAAFAGIYMILSISYYFSGNRFLTTFFTTFGVASLFILLFHFQIHNNVYTLLHEHSIFNSFALDAIIAFIISISVPLLIREVILKSEFLKLFYLPLKSNKTFQHILKK